MTDYIVSPSQSLRGLFRVPGDKSISHRSIMFGALADGKTKVMGFLQGADAIATMDAFKSMGVTIEDKGIEGLLIHGVGVDGLKAPSKALDLGNSGTAMRLMLGLLSGQSFDTQLIGDESLSSRPMGRVINPLTQMGAVIESDQGRAPLKVKGGQVLNGINYKTPMASAQVKSALLLAGIYAEAVTEVTEPAPTRDHTERMLRGFGYSVHSQKLNVRLSGGGRLTATNIDVPADISSAAFFLVAASIAEHADITIEHVGMNPTRIGILYALDAMGANIERLNEREIGGEPVADLRVRSAPLKGINLNPDWVPLAIDELPVFAVAAACASGETRITEAGELRVKESDRIRATVLGLKALGVEVEELDDGMVIQGGVLSGGIVESFHDHRISMAFTVAGLVAESAVTVRGCDNVTTSFPNFIALASSIGMNIEAVEGRKNG